MKPVVWGVLSTAAIGTGRVIPAMQQSALCDIRAIASRDHSRAAATAQDLGIPVAHGSYEALLDDPAIEAVYIPLPNHLHVQWALAALERGKHVLCEKPLALLAADVEPLLAARDRTGLICEEAFMVRDHPQWRRLRELIESGRIGALRSVQMSYSHTAVSPDDIRNSPHTGGGSLYDVGCYCIAVARLVFGSEPLSAMALADPDPTFGIDRWSTAMLAFEGGHASFFCSTQSSRCQLLQIIGSDGWIRVEVPFAHPPELGARFVIGANVRPGTEADERIAFDPVEQYRLQGERFSRLVRGEPARAWPLEDSIANLEALGAVQRAAASGATEAVR